MRCPTCNTENEAGQPACSNCRAALAAPAQESPPPKLPRKSRRRDKQGDGPVSPRAEGYNRDAEDAYRLCLFGLAPVLGLVLGPLSAFRASRLHRKAKDEPGFTGHGPARAAVVLGVLSGLTQWVGLALMVLGLLIQRPS
jgi:hypothetical protein